MRKKALFGIVLGSAIMLSCAYGNGFENKVLAATVQELVETVTENGKYAILDMPIVSITTEEETKIASKDYVNAKIEIVDEDGTTNMTETDISIRLRGNSTLNADKKSYKVKFEKKQNPLGIGDGKGKTWALLGNPYDVSLLRNLTMYKFGDKLTNMQYSPNCKSVEVYLNGEYQGVYLLSELVNVNKNRVNVTEAVDSVEENGYLVEMSRYAEGAVFDIDTVPYEIKSDLSETESIKEKQVNYISDYMKTCLSVLKKGDQKTVEQYIDVASLVDVYIGNEIVKNVDAGWDSVYMSKDAGGKLKFGPLWDFDLTLSNVDSVLGIDSYKGFSPFTILNVNASSNPWLCYAMENEWFRKQVQERWNELQADIDDLSNTVIREAEENLNSYLRNFEKWDIIGTQVYTQPKYITEMTSYQEHYTYLSDWIAKRTNWLTGKINTGDFINGVFEDYKGGTLSAKSNIFEMSSILILGWGGDQEYTIKDSVGAVVDIKKGGFGMVDICGFMVEEGQEYELSFDYSSTKEVSTDFAVQQNYGKYEQFTSGKLDLKPETQHITQRFTPVKTDSNCAFVINFRGSDFDNSVLTFDNIILTKVEKKSPISAEVKVTGDWGKGAICNMTITNDSDEDYTDGWSFDFDCNREITQMWNGVLTKGENGHYTVTNPDWKKILKAGESYTFGFLVGEGDEVKISNVMAK